MQKREFKLLTPGPASFYIKSVFNKDRNDQPLQSSTGVNMIKVVCVVTDSAGETEDVYVSFTENGLFFLEKLIKALDLPPHIKPNLVFDDPEILEGRQGKCVAGIRETQQWGKRNEITSFVRNLAQEVKPKLLPDLPGFIQNFKKEKGKPASTQVVDPELDDDIPF